MYRLNRLNSAGRFCTFFTASTATAYPKRFLRPNLPVRSLAFTHSSCRRVMESPPPTATPGIDDYVDVGDAGEGSENSPENESGISGRNSGYETKVLPPELCRSAVTLTCESSADGGVCDVYLVGTVHVSSKSCKEVQAVIDFLKPQVVFLELCPSRIAMLAPQNLKIPTFGEMVEMWKKNLNLFGILNSWCLARVASKLEVLPGAEFRVAYEEAMKYGGKVILGDRPFQITWAKMPLWYKTKLMYSFLFQAVFLPSPEDFAKMLKAMDDVNMVTVTRKIQEMSKQFPTLTETLVHERDQYMSDRLLKVAREHNSVVAVVGKGHLPGIQKNWKQPVEMKFTS